MIRFYHLAISFLLIGTAGFPQTILDISFPKVNEQSLSDFLVAFEQRYAARVFFLDEWMAPYQVGPDFNGHTLRRILDEVLEGSDISYDVLFGYAIIFHKDPSSAIGRESILNRAVVQRKVVEQRIIGDKTRYRPGRPVVLMGTVRDQDEGIILDGTSVMLNEKEERITDAAGKFRFSIAPGNYVLTLRRPLYEDKLIDIFVYENGSVDITLQATPILLGEVVISDEMMLDRAIGKTNLNINELRRAPVFLGEADLIRQVQSQPGVTTVGEVASGFNVRGGGVDQNLVLYDDVPIFNTSHALGFFSAFHPEAIGEVSFYRGGIPAQYGGRASSVLNIVTRQGDLRKWTGGGGVGIISSHLTVGGPIKKDTSSIHLSIRSTYSNWMLKAVKSNYKNLRNTAIGFNDGSVKFAHRFSDKSKLTFSGYRSSDRFNLVDDTTFHWTNSAASLRLDHSLNEKLFSSVSLAYGNYTFMVSETDPSNAFDLEYSITYPSVKIDFHADGRHRIAFGLHNTYYAFHPGSLEPRSSISNVRSRELDEERSLESALYLSDAYQLSNKVFAEGGIRLSVFNRLGPATVYRYAADAPKEVHSIQDSAVYRSGEISRSYLTVEPRVSLRYTLDDNTSVKLGYHRMAQYMHLVTNTAALMPTDIWQSSNAYFKPQVADQVSFGVFRNFREIAFETFVETYYKRTVNTLDFKDGADLILNRHLETALIPTSGTAYGVELSLARVRGRLQGSVNYTFSRSFRQAKSLFDAERVNDGKVYPANHDLPHVVNTTWRYAFSRRIHFSGNFVYHTGRPVSMPSSVYAVDGVPISDFSARNRYRIPDYHRLDLAFIIEGNHKIKKPWSGHWIFSFYNVYARKNAYSAFFADDGRGILKPYRLSVIGTVIPSVTYSFRF